MRLVMLVCGLALVAGPVFAQKTDQLMPAPRPEVMQHGVIVAQGQTRNAAQPTPAKNQAPDPHFNQQVSAAQQRLQQEEQRLHAQFAQIEKLRTVALEKQDQKELERINRLEQQVVAEYQKRVEQVLISSQTQIQPQPAQPQPTQPQPTTATKAQGQQKQPQTRKPTQPTQPTQQRQSSGFWLFGRR